MSRTPPPKQAHLDPYSTPVATSSPPAAGQEAYFVHGREGDQYS